MRHQDLEQLDDDEPDSLDSTYLTFQVGGEEYAVPVAHVTEIVRLQKSYSVPDVPAYIRGLINLRGKVIPLLDVRARFGMTEAAYDDRTVVVVLELADVATGLVVDGVSEVTEIPADRIEPRVGGSRVSGRAPLVAGIGKRPDRVTFILDVAALIAGDVIATTTPDAAHAR